MSELGELRDGAEGELGDNLVYMVLGHSFYLLSVNKNLKYTAKSNSQRIRMFFYFHHPSKLHPLISHPSSHHFSAFLLLHSSLFLSIFYLFHFPFKYFIINIFSDTHLILHQNISLFPNLLPSLSIFIFVGIMLPVETSIISWRQLIGIKFIELLVFKIFKLKEHNNR